MKTLVFLEGETLERMKTLIESEVERIEKIIFGIELSRKDFEAYMDDLNFWKKLLKKME